MTATEEAAGTERVSIPPNAFYVPSPVILLSTVNEDGEIDVSAMSAVGVVCLDPPVIAVGIKARRRTYRNIRRTGTFVVNLPLEQDLHAVDYTGTRKFRDAPDKVAESGLAIDRLPETGTWSCSAGSPSARSSGSGWPRTSRGWRTCRSCSTSTGCTRPAAAPSACSASPTTPR